MFNYTVYHKFYLSVDFKFNRFNNYNYKLLLKTFFFINGAKVNLKNEASSCLNITSYMWNI